MSEQSEDFPIQFRDDMTVELVKASASDSDVIWAARVSTAGDKSLDAVGSDASGAEGLINYLARGYCRGRPGRRESFWRCTSEPLLLGAFPFRCRRFSKANWL